MRGWRDGSVAKGPVSQPEYLSLNLQYSHRSQAWQCGQPVRSDGWACSVRSPCLVWYQNRKAESDGGRHSGLTCSLLAHVHTPIWSLTCTTGSAGHLLLRIQGTGPKVGWSQLLSGFGIFWAVENHSRWLFPFFSNSRRRHFCSLLMLKGSHFLVLFLGEI